MLAELRESDATGELATIYAEIRRLWGVPYVSSLQRHLATRPGWLPWTWAALGSVFASGRAQRAAWRASEGLSVPRLDPISRDALGVWGVDARGEAAIRAACASFVRVSPVNLVLSGLLRRLLNGSRPDGHGPAPAAVWAPPAPVGALPALVDPAALPAAERALLTSLGTTVGGTPFVAGLYRMLARWPAFFAHVATVVRPRMDAPDARAACRRLLDAVDAEVPAVFDALPALPAAPPMPAAAEFPGVLAALDTYRQTSPEMVVFGRMISDALPPLARSG
ncbi:MAG TPA: hypothetical protein VJU81_13065 [Methylomirabilota bacterium]|nr:hypothetical protein [Methylomirabilota bacterium]